MIKGHFVRVICLVLLLVFLIQPAQAIVQIVYSLEDMGSGRWKATYQVFNTDVSLDVSWLSIYFDYGLYDALSVETPSPLAEQWDQDVWNPIIIGSLPFSGLFDIQAKCVGILPGQSLAGFAVAFDWLGQGPPIMEQRFEVYDDPGNLLSPRVGTAVYIPEPATLLVLGVGAMILLFSRDSKHHYC